METGRMVHLEQPRLQLPIEHDVETQDFKAGTASVVVWEARSVVVLEGGVGNDQSLDDHILYVSPYLLLVVSVAVKPLVELRYLPEMVSRVTQQTPVPQSFRPIQKDPPGVFYNVTFSIATRRAQLLATLPSDVTNCALHCMGETG